MIQFQHFFRLSKMVLIYVVLLLIARLFTNICSPAEDLEDGICNRSTCVKLNLLYSLYNIIGHILCVRISYKIRFHVK